MTTLPSVAWEESGKASDSRPGLLAFPEHGHRCWFSSEGAMTVKVYPKNAYFFFRILRLFLKKHTFKSMWIKKWYVCTMEYYSAAKRNKMRSSVEMWVGLESVCNTE